MCTGIVETASIWGSGKGPLGWFPLRQVSVSYDHPFHAPAEHTLNLDFLNEAEGLGARAAVELNSESARAMVQAILEALGQGEQVCTGIIHAASVWGSGKGPQGWFPLRQGSVTFDYPSHTPAEFTINIDFRNDAESVGTRVAVELNPESAQALAQAMVTALERGQEVEARS